MQVDWASMMQMEVLFFQKPKKSAAFQMAALGRGLMWVDVLFLPNDIHLG